MAVIGSLIVLLGANNTALTAGLLKAEGELKAFGNTADTTTARTGAIFGGIGLVAAAGMGLAIKAAADFQEQMAIINTIALQTPEELTKTGDSIRALAVSSGTALSDLTTAYYDLLSAGIEPGTEAMSVLTQANTLAIGGLATTAQTVDLLTTAINAYGLDSKGAAVATDQFALAVKDGKVTAGQIADTFADVAPVAKTAGIGIDEIAAAYAVLTAQGVKPADAMTEFNRAIIELLKPGKELLDLQKKTGINFAELAADKGLVVSLQAMRDAAEANNVPFQDLFGRLEGFKFALATTGPDFANFAAELAKMQTGSGGTALEQMDQRMGTLVRQFDIFKASVGDLAITLGTALLPPVTAIFQTISSGVQSVTTWAQANPGLSSSLLPVITAVGLLGAGLAVLGAPFVVIAAGVVLVITQFDALQRGIQVVIDTIQRMIDLARIGADTVAGIPGVKAVTDVAGAGVRAVSGDFGPTLDARTFRQQFLLQTGRAASPLDYAAYQRGDSPIQLTHTTNVHLDGERVGQIIDRRLYDSSTATSSGGVGGHGPLQ